MDKTRDSSTSEAQPSGDDLELPPGNHALEVAARRGIGPLSPCGRDIWHGEAMPCVSCGQLVTRDADDCAHCGQDLSEGMLETMLAHAGPWYVLEHVRPFPGITLERIIRQIRRKLITETSIVRGPETDHQWRFAGETVGLCRYFGYCWNCHEAIQLADTACPRCQLSLTFEETSGERAVRSPNLPHRAGNDAMSGRPVAGRRRSSSRAVDISVPGDVNGPTAVPGVDISASSSPPLASTPADPHEKVLRSGPALAALSEALHSADMPRPDVTWDAPPRIGGIRATWIAVAMLVVVIIVFVWIIGGRNGSTVQPKSTSPGTLLVAPPV